MMGKIKRYIKVLRELVRIRFQNLMMFRLGFFGPFFVDGSLFAVQLVVFDAVYSNVDRIGSWGRGEMILFIGTFSFINAVNMVIYFFGVNDIPAKIKSGQMDLYLTKPISPLFYITLERINPGSVPLVLMSICIIVYGAKDLGIAISGGKLAGYLIWLVFMIVLYYEMEIIIRSVPFYLVSNAKLEQLEEAGIDLCMKLPGIAFYGIYKLIFYCILPYGIMATLPVQTLLGEMSLCKAVHGLAIFMIFTGITMFIWKKGVRHYNSASS